MSKTTCIWVHNLNPKTTCISGRGEYISWGKVRNMDDTQDRGKHPMICSKCGRPGHSPQNLSCPIVCEMWERRPCGKGVL